MSVGRGSRATAAAAAAAMPGAGAGGSCGTGTGAGAGLAPSLLAPLLAAVLVNAEGRLTPLSLGLLIDEGGGDDMILETWKPNSC